MKKDPKIFIEHILESILSIEEYTEGKTKGDFLRSRMIQDAVIRRIEVIGEAVKNCARVMLSYWKVAAMTKARLIRLC